MKKLIDRPQYLAQLIGHKDVDLVKIITGIRRCGKSSLLDLFHLYLLETGVSDGHIIHLNLESMKYRNLTDYVAFYDFVASQIQDGQRTYLMFDELQNVEHWEKAIESFRLDFDVDIYITGSNAYLLSSEFSTLLSGRYVEIRVFPLSFAEFLTFNTWEDSISIEEKFQKYLQFGGMPILSEYHFDETRCNQALEGIYSTIILRDIMQRNSQINQNTLQRITLFLCSNIGNITSPNNMGNVLSSDGAIESSRQALTRNTVERYITLLKNAFLFIQVNRYDVKGKQLLKTLEKDYIIDLGFRNLLLGYRDVDRGHMLENVVYLELMRRGYRVYIGKVGTAEVDFIAEKPNEKKYIQVTESLLSEDVRDRELRPLHAIHDHYEKIVLSMDRSFINSEDGIKLINLIDWLLENN
ncbi:ATP-binding protein [Dubosiella muris]|uniref:ATP-binding protein n=3 Tax=Dubosiella TaxID=1937008 RepID=A0AC61R6K9_9FIRM|nr:ATP-binding protein [Dubosiella muris]TGY65675.1 ATP-binding protein [Dubosiella muris]